MLEIRGVSKSFWRVQALDDVSFDVRAGEIHAVAGENGAGKSTLMKIIAGQERADSGEVRFHGRAIAMIHQELLPFPDLSVSENILMGQEPARWMGWVDHAERDRRAGELLRQLGLNIDPRARMGGLTVAEKQSVEIAKALARQADLLIMDEPTSALSSRESELLFRIIGDLKARGASILYISHRMQEIFRLADRITVMRDGKHVATRPAAELDEDRLITLMVGRELAAFAKRQHGAAGEVALGVRGLGRSGRFHDVSFALRRGEILGLAGLMGAGRSDIAAAIYGLAPATSGEVLVDGRQMRIASPADAIAAGIAMVHEDRREFGFVPDMSVKENMTLSSLGRVCSGPWIRGAAEERVADEQIRRFDVRASGRDQAVQTLSGGNQQKVAIARALLTDPQVLILDEPTRGIDVGAKAEIYALIAELAAQRKAILLISSEMNEILALSDRVLVMREGVAAGEFRTAETNAEEILRYAIPS